MESEKEYRPMRIRTKDFGELDINSEAIIKFPRGLFAFEGSKEFILIEKEGYKQKWLQAVDSERPRFIVFDPTDIVLGYLPELPVEALKELKLASGECPDLYVVAVIPENIKDMTVNLKSPLLINKKERLAVQIVLEKGDFPIRYRVFKEDKRGARNANSQQEMR
jgi:flagellar assembly factor FliW